ncbi:MAG TPA: DUF6531 domain-containing protein [Chloroflexia bacterium]|nr:DUF6531 domain-containing protein [Chloroflexia bacterium]
MPRRRKSTNRFASLLLVLSLLLNGFAVYSPPTHVRQDPASASAAIVPKMLSSFMPGVCQAVEWTTTVNVTVAGNSIMKTSGGNNWNAGAASWQSFTSGEGSVQITADATNSNKIFGFTHNNTTPSWEDIDFGIQLNPDGTITARRSGSAVFEAGSYQLGDVLKVAVEYNSGLARNVVRWYRNSTALYTDDNPTISYPLRFDTTIAPQGNSFTDAFICAQNLSNPPIPASGITQRVEWTTTINVTENANSITKTSGGTGWNAGAASWQSFTSGEGSVQVTVDVTNTNKIFGLTHANTTPGWEDIDFGIQINADNTLTVRKSGAAVIEAGNCQIGDVLKVAVEYDVALSRNVVRWYRNNTRLYTDSNPTISYPLWLDTALPIQGESFTNAFIRAQNLSNPTIPLRGDNQAVEWTTTINVTDNSNSITKTLGGNSWNAGAASWQSFTSGEGSVSITADITNTNKIFGLTHANTTPSWEDIDFGIQLNPDNTVTVRRSGAAVIEAGIYRVGDVFRVAVEYDVSLARNVVRWYRNNTRLYTDSNPTIIYPLRLDTTIAQPGSSFTNAYIRAVNLDSPPLPVCDSSQAAQWTNLVNVTVSGTTITKTSGGTGWNGGAASQQTIASGEGSVQITADVTTDSKIIGLTHNETSPGWDDIDFGVQLNPDSTITVRRAGAAVMEAGNYQVGDILKVAVEYDATVSRNVVRWYRNNTRLYTDLNPTITYPLRLDIALSTQGTSFTDGSVCTAFRRQDSIAARSVNQSNGTGCDSGCGSGFTLDPVNMATGNLVWQETDLGVDAPGLPFAWQRTYNSRDTRSGLMGRAWSVNYDARLDLSDSAQVTVFKESGPQSIYTLAGTEYLPPPGERSQLKHNLDGTYQFVRPDQSSLRFSSTGQLLSKSDNVGRTVSLVYTNGVLSSLTDSVGRTYSVETDSQGRVTQLNDTSVQRSVIYTYTGELLTDVKDVLGRTAHYNYTDGLLTSITLPDGSTRVENHYDTLGRVVWQDAWDTTPFTVTYGLAAPPITSTQTLTRTLVVDAFGRTTAYDHDIAGRMIRQIDPDGHSSVLTVNINDQPTQARDPLGNKTTYTYDSRGNILAHHDATGRGADYTYDTSNRLLTEQDMLGHTTTYTYTTEGLLRQITDPLGNTATYTYTAIPLRSGGTMPLASSSQDALGRVTHFGYNDLGQATIITNTLGQVVRLEYDDAGRNTAVVDPAGVSACMEYDAADHLTASVQNCLSGQPATASQNVRTEYGYDTVGRRVWTRSPLGEVTRIFYGNGGQVSKTVAGCTLNGSSSTSQCDAFDQALPERNRTTLFEYDGLGHQVAMTNTLGIATRTEYTDVGHPFKTTHNYDPTRPADPTTNVINLAEYNEAGQVSATIDPLGWRNVPHYDAAGRVTEQIHNYLDGNPSTGTGDTDLITRSDYDVVGQPVTTTINFVDGVWDSARPDEDIRQLTRYDALNRPTTSIENYVDGVSSSGEVATDRITQYSYDAVGNLIATTDPLGRVSVTVYDGLNRPIEQISNCTDGSGQPRTSNCASGHSTLNDENIRTSTTYNTRGLVETSTDSLGRVSRTSYDNLGRVIEQVENEGGSTAPADVTMQYGYDYTTSGSTIIGYNTVITDALDGVRTSEYNKAGWLLTSIDPTDRAVTYAYDGLGRMVSQTDALGHESRTIYDAMGRTWKSIVNYQNGVVETADGLDRDLITEYVYDVAGRRVAVISPDGKRTNYTLDGVGNLVTVVENVNSAVSPANVTTSYSYDKRGLLTGVTDALDRQRIRDYNAAGWLISETDALTRTTIYAYDKAGRLLTTADPRPVTLSYAYDALDRLTGISAPNLTSISMGYDVGSRRTSLSDETGSTSYSYDGLGRLTTQAHSVDGTVSYGYDVLSRRTSVGTNTGAPSVTYAYDDAGRLEEVKRGGVTHATASYDDGGRLGTITRANGADTLYSYDGADRLASITTTVGVSNTLLSDFEYVTNRGGQVITVTETLTQNTRTIGYSYDGLQRLVGANESVGHNYTYSYDLVGNRTAVSVDSITTGRTYDAADQVVGTGWQYDGAGNLLSDGTNSYTYDPLKRLTSVASGGITTTYGYNGDGVLATEAVGGATTRYTLDVTGGLPERLGATTGSASTWYVRGWGGELSRESGGTTNAWYLGDRLGTVRGVMDGSGALMSGYNYDPYGTPEGISLPDDYGFTGEVQNATNGLVHLRARWYNTSGGRFNTDDPFRGWAKRPMSLHSYHYVYNNPINGSDPTGLDCDIMDMAWGNCTPSGKVRCDEPGKQLFHSGCASEEELQPVDLGLDPLTATTLGAFDTVRHIDPDPIKLSQAFVSFQEDLAAKLCPWGGCRIALSLIAARKGGGFGVQPPGVWIPKPSSGTIMGPYCPIWPGYKGSQRQLSFDDVDLQWQLPPGKIGPIRPMGVSLPKAKRNLDFAGKVFHPEDVEVSSKYPNGVRFTENGYPDFTPYAIVEVKIKMKGNYTTDYEEANKAAGIPGKRPPVGYTWHHHEDRTTMLLVPEDLHRKVGHDGGIAVIEQLGVLP